MPLPFILGAAAIVAGVTGAGTGIHGAVKMKEANDTMQSAKSRHEDNIRRLEKKEEKTTKTMDKLGTLELEILNSFKEFSDVFEIIKNRPVFEEYTVNGVKLPKYDGESIKEVSVGAGVILGGLGSAGLGVASGIAAGGATTMSVMALGTASTGAAIQGLSGAAATNATLAALGGGSLAAGGGGIALGTQILGGLTLGAGLLVGGLVFNAVGGKMEDKACEAWSQMMQAEKSINEICDYLNKLDKTAGNYRKTLTKVNKIYSNHLAELKNIVLELKHDDWNLYTIEEKKITQNTVLLVGLLYNMCKVQLVIKSEKENEMNKINSEEVENSINTADTVINEKFSTEE